MELQYNRDNLKEAVVLLLSRYFGKKRIAHLRDWITGRVRVAPVYKGNLLPLREIVNIARQGSLGRQRMLQLLDNTEQTLDQNIREFEAQYPAISHQAMLNRVNQARMNRLVVYARMAEDFRRLSRGMVAMDAGARDIYITARKKAWATYKAQYAQSQRSSGKAIKAIYEEAFNTLHDQERTACIKAFEKVESLPHEEIVKWKTPSVFPSLSALIRGEEDEQLQQRLKNFSNK